ncbi:MAG: hypothetical protein ABFS19_06075 [Thermodesulfobacteriota bacterium]
MNIPPRVITSNQELFSNYDELQAGDIISGRIRLRPGEEHLLTDLSQRGIRMIPSATAQLASRSKCFQTRLFGNEMVPHSRVIYDIHAMLDTMNLYHRHQVTKVVVKDDAKDGGFGIFLFRDIEEVYFHAANSQLSYPFVVQPFVSDCRDIRAIFLGDYHEAYERSNPDNFRNNLHCGGSATPLSLSREQLELCHRVLKRGSFDYGHIDLMVAPDGKSYLAEINLRGGIRGAQIKAAEYRQRLDNVHEQLVREITA